MKNLFVFLLIFVVVKALVTKDAEKPATSITDGKKEIADQDDFINELVFEIGQDGRNKINKSLVELLADNFVIPFADILSSRSGRRYGNTAKLFC